MAASIESVNFECQDPPVVAQFWATALGYSVVDGNVPGEIEVKDPAGAGVSLYLMPVPEPKANNRFHLDLTTDQGMSAEVERLVAAGARVIDVRRDPPGLVTSYEWTVMADPEDNEFWVVQLITGEE